MKGVVHSTATHTARLGKLYDPLLFLPAAPL